ncbi:MAG: cytochrome-c oxidase, cbb3-type subunit II [Candidatus Sericytochromatia bacterium]|uniref:Cytochrome-c oxidase, cbb3-type subunit II n=1 Tax=Candidatus Tanganyikabacteria bacterium TaxID=2961651 RepID=A0A937X6W6_9BACT|nr:cytochrome-c oxidase, cbb3-type subunit II [Candidatus Tanganyikabacteria bacterium]
MSFHEGLERKGLKMALLAAAVVSVGGLVEIVPLFFLKDTVPHLEGVRPYPPLQLEGRDIYVREGCYNCHSQMIRPFRVETARYGPYSRAAESQYDRPFQWGSKRTGPDLARIGGKYPDGWHVQHMRDPRSIEPNSNMPGYPWLEKTLLDTSKTRAKLIALRHLGVSYTDEEIASAEAEVGGKSELDALIAYLQGLGTALKQEPAPGSEHAGAGTGGEL